MQSSPCSSSSRDERRDEQGAVLCHRQGLRWREHQRDVGADAFLFELAGGGDARRAGELDDEVAAQRGNDAFLGDHLVGLFQVRIDFHRDREDFVAVELVVLDPAGDVLEYDLERLAAVLRMWRVGGDAVDAEGVVGEVDFVELGARPGRISS